MDRFVRSWFVIYSKFSLLFLKFILYALHLVYRFSALFHLHIYSSLCLKILTTIFDSKFLYIKPSYIPQKSKNRLPSTRARISSVFEHYRRYCALSRKNHRQNRSCATVCIEYSCKSLQVVVIARPCSPSLQRRSGYY